MVGALGNRPREAGHSKSAEEGSELRTPIPVFSLTTPNFSVFPTVRTGLKASVHQLMGSSLQPYEISATVSPPVTGTLSICVSHPHEKCYFCPYSSEEEKKAQRG